MGQIELAILKAAQAGGYLDAIPENDEDVISEANFYLAEARKSYENGMKGDKTIKEIVNLGKKLGEQTVDNLFGTDEAQLYRGLPVPPDIHAEPVPMPFDLSELSPKEIMKLHAQYNAYLGRARWMYTVVSNKLSGVVHLRDAEYRRAYKDITEKARKNDEKPTKDYIDSLARQDDAYVDYDNKARLHNEDALSYKALVEIYSGNVDTLSRHWTMRQDEEKQRY
jgi:hypothetical protein